MTKYYHCENSIHKVDDDKITIYGIANFPYEITVTPDEGETVEEKYESWISYNDYIEEISEEIFDKLYSEWKILYDRYSTLPERCHNLKMKFLSLYD